MFILISDNFDIEREIEGLHGLTVKMRDELKVSCCWGFGVEG